MAALLRVCRNIMRRFFPHCLWLMFAFIALKVTVITPWNAKWDQINQDVQQLQKMLEQKEGELTKLYQSNIQQAVESAIEKERPNTQRLVESAISTNLAQHTVVQAPPAAETHHPVSDWDKAWPIIEQRFHSSQPWSDALPQNTNAPENLKRNTAAPTCEQIIAACHEAASTLDSSMETSSSWLSSMIRVRRLDNLTQHSTKIIELIQKKSWQEALTQLEEHSLHDHPKIRALIDQLRDRLHYEQAFAQLITWKQQLCATSALS